MKVHCAVAQYRLSRLATWAEYVDKQTFWVRKAADQNATLLVFPEYAGMELTSLLTDSDRMDLTGCIFAMQHLISRYITLFSELAARWNVTIMAGSVPVVRADEKVVNRAMLFSPAGLCGYQDKMILTRFERESWCITPGNEINAFDSPAGKLGIAVCYDCEFPLLVRKLANAGAKIIIVPSCTESRAGFHRVRVGCQARAMENQLYVLQATLIGESSWVAALTKTQGRASIYGPISHGFSDTGILEEANHDREGWLFSRLPLTLLSKIRRESAVQNFSDWHRQPSL